MQPDATNSQIQHSRSLSETTASENAVPLLGGSVSSGPPNINAQMQKLLEQKLRNNQAGANSMNPIIAPRPDGPSNRFNGIGSNVLMPNPPQGQAAQKPVVWTGALQWSGVGNNGVKKDVRTVVAASTLNHQER